MPASKPKSMYADLVGGGIYDYGPNPAQSVSMTNTLVTIGPAGENCYRAESSGVIQSNGYNLSSDWSCALFFNQPGDQNNQNLNLGPLADNGGPTLTHMPNAPSPATDAI